MKKITVLALTGMMMMFLGCGPSREKTIQQIGTLEKSLFSPDAVSFNKEKADSLLSLYELFVEKHPKDSLAPGFIFKAANIAMNSGDGPRALGFFDQYLQNFPDGPKASISLFFKAFIYENMIQNLDKARETYLLFIEKYPNDDFAKDARLAVMNLGKSPDELIRQFEEQRKIDSIRVADSLAKIKKSGKKR